jgi:hypothetical protein
MLYLEFVFFKNSGILDLSKKALAGLSMRERKGEEDTCRRNHYQNDNFSR